MNIYSTPHMSTARPCPTTSRSQPVTLAARNDRARSLGCRHRRALPVLGAAIVINGSGPLSVSPILDARRSLTALVSSPHDKAITAVALPAMLSGMLDPLINAFNAALVGHLGTQQLSAVSLGTILISASTFLFSFLLFLTVPDVAAAVAKKDNEEVSRVAAQGLWVAAGCGIGIAALLYCNAGAMVAAMKPPEPAVAALATEYLRIRALALPFALLGFVNIAVFRGCADTRTPLLGTGAAAATSLALHLLFLNVMHLGVAGAATAATAAQAVSCGVMLSLLVRRGVLLPRHLAAPPRLAEVAPLLRRGLVLSVRNVFSFGIILFASGVSVRLGAASQAAFEVCRQLWMLTMPLFECFNVATQALCAAALGRGDAATARALLLRLLALGTGVAAAAGCAIWLAQTHLIAFFTHDPAVVQQVLVVLPLLCACFPLDAAGSIMDGSLLAARKSNYMSAVQIGGCMVQYGFMSLMAGTGQLGALVLWGAIKLLSVVRIGGGAFYHLLSKGSAYRGPDPAPAPAAPAVAAAGPVAAHTSPPTQGATPDAPPSSGGADRGQDPAPAPSPAGPGRAEGAAEGAAAAPPDSGARGVSPGGTPHPTTAWGGTQGQPEGGGSSGEGAPAAAAQPAAAAPAPAPAPSQGGPEGPVVPSAAGPTASSERQPPAAPHVAPAGGLPPAVWVASVTAAATAAGVVAALGPEAAARAGR